MAMVLKALRDRWHLHRHLVLYGPNMLFSLSRAPSTVSSYTDTFAKLSRDNCFGTSELWCFVYTLKLKNNKINKHVTKDSINQSKGIA